MMKLKFIAAALVALCAVESKADVLFLDLNNAPLEIAAARRAATARGERLIVIPSSGNSARLSQAQLNQELATLKRNNVNLSTVVISGHDGNGHFGGERGSINADGVREAFAQNSPLGNNVRSLMLWGCYTATPGSIEFRWRNTMPNLAAVVGFDGSAPSRDRLGSHTYLEDYLRQERQILATRDANALNRQYQSLRNVRIMASAACINETYLQAGRAPRSMQEVMGSCRSTATNVQQAEQFACYVEARRGCEDPPANTPTSPLRLYYNELQNTAHCNEQFEEAGVRRADPDDVIRIILFDNVVANAQRLQREQIEFINRALAENGAQDDG